MRCREVERNYLAVSSAIYLAIVCELFGIGYCTSARYITSLCICIKS